MNREETKKLWQECEDVRRKALADSPSASAEEAHVAATKIWNDRIKEMPACDAAADFSRVKFIARTVAEAKQTQGTQENASPNQSHPVTTKETLHVSDTANFESWIFPGDAKFDEAEFHGTAQFNEAQFHGKARFNNAQFHGEANFEDARFASDAIFGGMQSRQSIAFPRVRFEGFADFSKSTFESDSDFAGIRSESSFDMTEAKFMKLPNFVQASFKEAPRLDHIELGSKVEPGNFLQSLGWHVGLHWLNGIQCSNDVTSKYRALKRLAIQGHDHEREHLFFKRELRSRRTSEERWWQSRYWLGIIYDVVSDFGRSIGRPAVCWLLWAVALAKLYALSAAPRVPSAPIIVSGVFGGPPAIAALPPGDSCAHPFWEGLYLAVRNGFPLSGARDQRVIDGYSCLYAGSPGQAGVLPDIPAWISYAELAHTPISVILIFLIVLALRNQFKIK